MKPVNSILLIYLTYSVAPHAQTLTSLPGTWDEDSFYYLISKDRENSSKYSCLMEYNNDYKMTDCPTSNWSTPSLVDDSHKFYAIRSAKFFIQPAEGACMLFNKLTKRAMEETALGLDRSDPMSFWVTPSTATCGKKAQVWVMTPSNNVRNLQTGIGEARAFNILKYEEKSVVGVVEYQPSCYLSVADHICRDDLTALLKNESPKKMEAVTFLLPTKERLGIFVDTSPSADGNSNKQNH